MAETARSDVIGNVDCVGESRKVEKTCRKTLKYFFLCCDGGEWPLYFCLPVHFGENLLCFFIGTVCGRLPAQCSIGRRWRNNKYTALCLPGGSCIGSLMVSPFRLFFGTEYFIPFVCKGNCHTMSCAPVPARFVKFGFQLTL